MAASEVVAALKGATKGLLFPSESDEPIDVFEWPATGTLDEATVVKLGEEDPRIKVKRISLEDLFGNLVTTSSSDSPDEQEQAARFKQVLDVLNEHLSDIRVFRVGQVELNYYVVGTTKTGKWAGIVAAATET
ncbi:MAG TPA: nuclease A inhibitor family protein [Planctomycetaceae bacterium]|jgi:hypothetical protein|nr:nuclease A inhibitor family protein [Planctomycetaceae bacterium]